MHIEVQSVLKAILMLNCISSFIKSRPNVLVGKVKNKNDELKIKKSQRASFTKTSQVLSECFEIGNKINELS